MSGISCLLVLFIGLPFLAQAGEYGTIQLRKEAVVLTRTYSLADIAELDKIRPDLKEELVKIQIGSAPRPGHLTQITRGELKALLEQAIPGITKQVHWAGATSVRLRGSGVLCDVEALSRSAYECLHDWLQAKYGHFSAQLVGKPPRMIVAAGEIAFRPKLSPAIHLSARMPVWVEVLVDGEHFQTVPLWFSVSVQAPVMVLNGDIEKHQEVSPENLREELMDIAGLVGDPSLSISSWREIRATRDLKAGAVLLAGDVESMPAVSRGESITVYAQHGSVSLTVEGVALTDGNLLQQIKVKNPSSGESYRATVTGKNKARVN